MRLEDSWFAVDRLEHGGMPFIVAVNRFEAPAGPEPDLAQIREALCLSERVPLIDCDARRRESSKTVLITLVKYLAHCKKSAAARETAP